MTATFPGWESTERIACYEHGTTGTADRGLPRSGTAAGGPLPAGPAAERMEEALEGQAEMAGNPAGHRHRGGRLPLAGPGPDRRRSDGVPGGIGRAPLHHELPLLQRHPGAGGLLHRQHPGLRRDPQRHL